LCAKSELLLQLVVVVVAAAVAKRLVMFSSNQEAKHFALILFHGFQKMYNQKWFKKIKTHHM